MKSNSVLFLLVAVFCFASGCDLGTYNKRFKERERDASLRDQAPTGTVIELVGESYQASDTIRAC